VRYYGTVGGAPAVIVLAGHGDADGVRSLLAALRDGAPAASRVDVVALDRACAEQLDGYHDVDGGVHGAYGVAADDEPVVIALDPSVRVAAVERATDVDSLVGRIAVAIAEYAHDPSERTIVAQAPVLFVPNALSAELADQAIAAWRSAGAAATGVEATVGGGRGEVHDEQRKRRRDHTVVDEELLRTLTSHIGRRVMPELHRAFAYRATRFEGFKIGSYEQADHGFFEPHRDNLSAATAHRRFALSLNLNDDYDGGEALLFSGALLHEVLPVTRGRRFVLLSFLYGDEVRRSADH
jgi:predicted 2-oxoglutarate/Fe(II)-dependent dioxygenase YbiX